jgi:hypothetical protein
MKAMEKNKNLFGLDFKVNKSLYCRDSGNLALDKFAQSF